MEGMEWEGMEGIELLDRRARDVMSVMRCRGCDEDVEGAEDALELKKPPTSLSHKSEVRSGGCPSFGEAAPV